MAGQADDLLGESETLSRLVAAEREARAAGADDVEVSLENQRLGFARFGHSAFTQVGQVHEPIVRLRVLCGGRLGTARAGALDAETLAQAARRAVAVARLPGNPAASLKGFARAGESVVARAAAAATLAAGARERAELGARLFARAAAEGLLCAGAVKTTARELAVVTTGGVQRYALSAAASLELIAHGEDLTGDASGYAHAHGPDVAAFDANALADEAIWRAVKSRDAVSLAPGEYDVVLAPAAVAELLEWMAMTSFSARTVLDEASLLCGREVGSGLCAEGVTVMDDVGYAHPQVVPLGFDSEGNRRQRVVFVDGGKVGRACSDLATAGATGGESTGHAAGLDAEVWDAPGPATLVMEKGELSEEALCGRVASGRGLYVTRLHYVNGFLDTRRAVMTGMTRDGTFLIEGGKIGRAVRNLRFNDSIVEAFGEGRLGGVGNALKSWPTSWSKLGQVLAPSVMVRRMKFTGAGR